MIERVVGAVVWLAGAVLFAPVLVCASPRTEMLQMVRTYNAVHSLRADVRSGHESFQIEFEAPDRYSMRGTRVSAIVIGSNAWMRTTRSPAWKALPVPAGATIQEQVWFTRSFHLLGDPHAYRFRDRGMTPGLGHHYEYSAAGDGPNQVWVRPDHLPSRLELASGNSADFHDFNMRNSIEAP